MHNSIIKQVAHYERNRGSLSSDRWLIWAQIIHPSPSGMILPVLYGNADHGCLEKLQAAFWVGQVSYARLEI